MRYYLCIDDTDNLETKGTGWLAEQACNEMKDLGLGSFSAISRHQLFVHEDVPYTSHNSSMCMEMEECGDPEAVIRYMQAFLERNGAPGSDPGLCLVPETLSGEARERLIRFGNDAKCTVLNKGLAYGLAGELGVHLSEHGGTGDGVVGALAGVGLRMGGQDGRYRSWMHLGPDGTVMPAGEVARLCGAHHVQDEADAVLADETPVLLQEQIKLIRRHGQAVLLARPDNGNGTMRLLHKKELKIY
ncbi:hypothetical protein DND132_1416 [Pseudodesulfovibrio mercurii]|uniref:tRNA(Ile2) 2-agmatinylcytidine synthetase n=1 Tax=Pseudodesulfovibrio mercurii TaxID=641491 RepID=F0JDU2_9BACT|nr:hypothetical protein [Pseudodesulfovibrio mercurii]EGB14624.1 hypothetical protein DND132_1416 [Pseudodesulfovibrio mercurii]